jgi:uncharacterized protein YjbJ (UPF0337 family)
LNESRWGRSFAPAHLEGKRDQFVGALHEKYGYTREKAGDETARRLKK